MHITLVVGPFKFNKKIDHVIRQYDMKDYEILKLNHSRRDFMKMIDIKHPPIDS